MTHYQDFEAINSQKTFKTRQIEKQFLTADLWRSGSQSEAHPIVIWCSREKKQKLFSIIFHNDFTISLYPAVEIGNTPSGHKEYQILKRCPLLNANAHLRNLGKNGFDIFFYPNGLQVDNRGGKDCFNLSDSNIDLTKINNYYLSVGNFKLIEMRGTVIYG